MYYADYQLNRTVFDFQVRVEMLDPDYISAAIESPHTAACRCPRCEYFYDICCQVYESL